jgi:hypothetical protein
MMSEVALPIVLQHVAIEVAPGDLGRSIEFFECLDFERVDPPAALAADFTWLQREGAQIHLIHEQRPTVPARAHFALLTEELEATLGRLARPGFSARAGRRHWGQPRAHAIAPGGHRVELIGSG